MPRINLLFYYYSAYWAALFWSSYVAWLLTEGWIFSRDRRKVVGVRADNDGVWLIIMAILLGVFAGFIVSSNVAFRVMTHIRLTFIQDENALMWVGMVFRLWAVLTLGRYFRTTIVIQDDHHLIAEGPYRWLRHPAYTGALVTLAGLGLAMSNWLSLLCCFIPPLLAYIWRVRVEEIALRNRFGAQYEDYRQRRWAIIPLVW